MIPADYLDSHTPDLIALLQTLVRMKTVNPPGENYPVIADFLTRELGAIGLSAKTLPIPERTSRLTLPVEQRGYRRCNVLGKWKVAGARRSVHFNAHFDVVPVSSGWRHGDPFSGEEDGGWIYGRGTADMKGSIAALLMALRALKESGVTPRLNVEVSFTADEETDSLLGSGWLVEHAPIDPDYVIVMEGGDKDSVCCGHNGVVWLEVTVHGKAAHGSKPEQGINALEKMAALVRAFEDYKAQLMRRTFTTPEGKVMVPTVNLGGVFEQGAGAKVNTVPALARFTIDRRVLAVENLITVERELRAFLTDTARSIPQCRIDVKKIAENQPCFSEPKDRFFSAMAECVSRVRRRPVQFSVSTGFNDMHFFSHHLDVPTLGYGPGGEAYHAIDERARVRDLVSCAKIYAELLTRFEG